MATKEKDLKTIQFLTCGHVDDGKSTLIGRLLYDIGVVPDDQIEAAKNDDGVIDYSLFTDGLEDERRQGITIDVAYRYFRHDGCRYRIADTPGHLEYMRNMAVAAIASDIAVILVDGIHGVRQQTVQYSKIARFFGVRQFLVAINKMDAVGYSEEKFDAIKHDYLQQFEDDDTPCDVQFVPVSAIEGDNVATKSSNTPWYEGATVLEYLRQARKHTHVNNNLRLPLQHVIKDGDVRWYLGTLHGKAIEVGDKLVAVDTRQEVTVNGIIHSGKAVKKAERRSAIAISIEEDVDISRGTILSRASNPGPCNDGFYADILWLDKQYDNKESFQGTIKLHHCEEQVQITISGEKFPLKSGFVSVSRAVAIDTFEQNPHCGLFILIDPYTERVAGVGTITKIINYDSAEGAI